MTWQQRLRTVVATTLLALGGLGIVLTGVGWWIDRSFLSTGRFTGLADSMLGRKPVQDGIARAVVSEIESRAGHRLKLAEPFIASVVESIVTSDPFHEVFDKAVSSSHRIFVNRNARDLVLNLSSTLDDIRSVLKEVSPSLAADLPHGKDLRIKLAERTQLPLVWDWLQRVDRAISTLPLATLGLVAAGVAMASRRWRALALLGWITAGISVTLLVGVGITRRELLGRITDDTYRAGAGSAWDVVVHGLLVQTAALAVLTGLVAVGARWTDRNGGIAVYPVAARRAWGTVRAAAAEGVGVSTERPIAPAITGLVAAVLRWRLPAPEDRPRLHHAWRAGGLGVVGIATVMWPGLVTSTLLFVLGVGVFYLAVTEGVAAYRAPREVDAPGRAP